MGSEIFCLFITSSIEDFFYNRNLKFSLALLVFTFLVQWFLLTKYIWIMFFLFELISLFSIIFIFRFREERLKKTLSVFIITSISSLLLLYSIIEAPFSATFEEYSFSKNAITEIFLGICICIKSGLFPFLWPQIASIADISISAFFHSATAIQLGTYLLSKIEISSILSKTIIYLSYSHFLFILPIILLEKDIKKLLAHSTQLSIACNLIEICHLGFSKINSNLIFYQASLKTIMFFSIRDLKDKKILNIIDFVYFIISSLLYLTFTTHKMNLEYIGIIKGINIYIFSKIIIEFIKYPVVFCYSRIKLLNLLLIFLSLSYKLYFSLHLKSILFYIFLFFFEKIYSKIVISVQTKFKNRKFDHFPYLLKEFANKSEIIYILSLLCFIIFKEKNNHHLLSFLFYTSNDLIFIPIILFTFVLIIRTLDKFLLVFYMNIIGIIIAILFSSYSASEIAVTQILADMLFALILLKSNLKVLENKIPMKGLLLAPMVFFAIMIYHPGINPGLKFPINKLEKIILDYRLIDTLFEVLIFYLIGTMIYSKNEIKREAKYLNKYK